ncbi:hypothetical protein [Hydrogenophaga sp. 2FB]|uniref:hypothetical protein n=1 Tax=Hydrogenophaga sp. 2FB TaxID=2502187 RepID=UPI0010F4BEA0|nr:hypothetical protein [Hydrogenophaga sp. 2FB]
MSSDSFLNRARSDLRASLTDSGTNALDALEQVFKSRAKTLQRELPKEDSTPKLMKLQESMAKALGFHNTHALQETIRGLRGLIDDGLIYFDEAVRSRFGAVEALVPLFRLAQATEDFDDTGFGIEEALVPGPFDIDFLQEFCARLAQHIPYSQPALLDGMARSWIGQDDWQAVHSEEVEVGRALMKFVVFGDLSKASSYGRFELTEEGVHVSRRLPSPLHYPDKDSELTEEHRKIFFDNLGMFETCNSMLMCALNVVELLRWFPDLGEDLLPDGYSEQVIIRATKAADKLVPAGFRGKIPYLEDENRDYIAMLAERMCIGLEAGDSWEDALRRANKLMRICPDVGLGIREQQLVLQAVVKGDSPKTRAAIQKIRGKESASRMLAAGTALVVLGDEAGLADIVSACFHDSQIVYYVLESMLHDKSDPFGGPTWSENLREKTSAILQVFNRSEKLNAWLSGIVADKRWAPEVRAVRLRMPVCDGVNSGRLEWSQWSEKARGRAIHFAQVLLADHPLPTDLDLH